MLLTRRTAHAVAEERDFELLERLFSSRSRGALVDTVTLSDASVHRLHGRLAILDMAEDTQKNSANLTCEERVLLKRREKGPQVEQKVVQALKR